MIEKSIKIKEFIIRLERDSFISNQYVYIKEELRINLDFVKVLEH